MRGPCTCGCAEEEHVLADGDGAVVCKGCGECLYYEEDDPLEDANGYTRADLQFGGNWS